MKNPIHSVTVFVKKDTPIGTIALEGGEVEILQIGVDGRLDLHLKDDARQRLIDALQGNKPGGS